MAGSTEFYGAARLAARTVRREIGRAVLNWRRERRLTLGQVARLTLVSAVDLDRLELGKDTLDLALVARVSVGLNLALGPLLDGRLVQREPGSRPPRDPTRQPVCNHGL
jgi:transcriptional regulator with XRE-family HTH domain